MIKARNKQKQLGENEQKVRLYQSKYRGFFTSPSYGIISMKYDYGITTKLKENKGIEKNEYCKCVLALVTYRDGALFEVPLWVS